MSGKVKEKPEIILLNLTFKDFPFYSFTIFLKTFGWGKNKRKNRQRKNFFAILEFACKMLQKLSSKMLKHCPTAVFSGFEISYLPASETYGPNSPQSECSYLLQHLITKKLKSPDSDDTILQQYKSDFWIVEVPQRGFFSSFRPVENECPDSFLHKQTARGEARGFRIVANNVRNAYTIPWPIRGIGFPWEKWQSILRTNMNEETLIYYRLSIDKHKMVLRTWDTFTE